MLHHPDLQWHAITLRPNERGLLQAKFARCWVWLVIDNQLQEEWFLIRKDTNRATYIFSNASPQISLEAMAWRKSRLRRAKHNAFTEM